MKHKIITKITAILMAIAVLFSCLAMAEKVDSPETPVAKEYTSTIFQKDQILSVNILMEESEWKELLENALDETYVPCDVEVNGTTYYNVAIRAKGNTSLSQVSNDRYSFKIQFDKYQASQTCDGLDQLVLNNNFCDATYLKEYLAYDMFRYMGVVTPSYAFADVKINGETYGLYLALEGVKESFAQRNYGTAHGELYKPEPQGMGGGNREGREMKQGNRPENMPEMNNVETTKNTTSKEDVNQNINQSKISQNNSSNQEKAQISSEDQKENIQTPPEDTQGNAQALPENMQGNTQTSSEDENGKQKDIMRDGRDMDMGGSSGGSDLVYTDDNPDSYSTIFDSAVFDTTNATKERLIKALKGLASGANLEKYVDVDACLRYFAVQSFIVNYDSYMGTLKHNYYLYEKDGKITMLPWDLNLAFAGYQSNQAESAIHDPIDTPVSGTTLEARPLIGKLLENEKYLEQYHQYIEQFITGYINSDRYKTILTQMEQLIDAYVKEDPTAFYTYDEFKTAVDHLILFCQLRGESVEGQLNGKIPSTSEEQQKDHSSFIETGDLSISAMGTMGGGNHGGKGLFSPENKNNTEQEQNQENVEVDQKNRNQTDRKEAMAGFQGGQRNGNQDNMKMPRDFESNINQTINWQGAILLFGGVLLLCIVGFIIKVVPRRKFHS